MRQLNMRKVLPCNWIKLPRHRYLECQKCGTRRTTLEGLGKKVKCLECGAKIEVN